MTPEQTRGPQFLGIGAPRSGTTWLHANLKRHPQLWLPPLKELHYWDFQRFGAAKHNPLPNVNPLLGWLRWRTRHSRQIVNRLLTHRATLSWALRYQFGWRSDHWYAKLFPTKRVAGEITPGYMIIPEPVVEAVRALNPNLKIIFLLRNPVSRAWSNLRLKLGDKVMQASDETILKGMEAPGATMRSNYVRTIRIWRSVFDQKQMFIGFYDDLCSNPRQLLRSILEFLQVDSSDARIPPQIDKVVHPSASRELPPHLLPRLYAHYLPQLRELESMVGGPVSKWRAKAEEAVKDAAAVKVAGLLPQLV